jgi:hypothetical protein
MRMGIGIGWPNANGQATPPPTVYIYSINNCGGYQGEAYSTSSAFLEGMVLYTDIGLNSLANYSTWGEPFNEFPNEPVPGYFCDNNGVLFNSLVGECP